MFAAMTTETLVSGSLIGLCIAIVAVGFAGMRSPNSGHMNIDADGRGETCHKLHEVLPAKDS